MKQDPIVQEVRSVRESIAEECDYDVHRIAEMFRAAGQKAGRTYVSPAPRRPAGWSRPGASEEAPDSDAA